MLMVTVNAGKRTEDDSVEWRVESRVSRGRRTLMRWLSRGTDLLRGLPNQRLYGGVAGEVVTEERASGSNRLRGKAQGSARVIGWRASVIGKLLLDLYVRSSAARSATDPCRAVAWQIPRLSSFAASTSFHRMPAPVLESRGPSAAPSCASLDDLRLCCSCSAQALLPATSSAHIAEVLRCAPARLSCL
jgi:hypothetical protein